MVDVDGGCQLSTDSQPKSIGLDCGLAATRRSVCIHQMTFVMMKAPQKHCRGYYYYYYTTQAAATNSIRNITTRLTKQHHHVSHRWC